MTPPSSEASKAPLFGLLWALVAVTISGWRFGVADHGIHLPTIDMVFHADRWAGDLLLDAAPHHHSWLPRLLAPAVEALGAAPLFAGLHAAVLVAIGALLWLLGRALGLGPRGAAAAAFLAAVPLDVPGGAATLDPLLLHRMVALPFELAAVLALVRGRVVIAFALVGAAVNVHAPSAVATAAGLFFAAVAAGVPLGRGLAAAGTALVLGAPTWVEGLDGSAWVRVDDAWLSILEARVSHHLFPTAFPWNDWAVIGILSAGTTLAGLEGSARTRIAASFCLGLAVFAVAVGSLMGPLAGLAIGLQLQGWQATRLIALLAVPVMMTAAHRANLRLSLVGIFAVVLSLGHSDEPRRFEIFGPEGDEAAVARWAAAEAADGDVFLVPPHRFGGFRAIAGRPVVVTWKDGGEATFDRKVALEWRRRIESVCGCSVTGSGGVNEMRERLARGWEGLSPSAIRFAAAREGARWIVMEADRATDPVFRAGRWAVEAAPDRPAIAP